MDKKFIKNDLGEELLQNNNTLSQKEMKMLKEDIEYHQATRGKRNIFFFFLYTVSGIFSQSNISNIKSIS